MKLKSEKVIEDIFEELRRAEEKFPGWPEDPFHALAIITEEHGETYQALLQAHYQNKPLDLVYREAVQLAAMSFRFLLGWEIYTFNKSKQVDLKA